MSEGVSLHGITGPRGSRLERLAGDGLKPVAPLGPVSGCFERIVAAVTPSAACDDPVAGALSCGQAQAEARAVRLRRVGASLRWDAPIQTANVRSLLGFCRARGRASVELARSDPSLVTELQLGTWFDAPWQIRLGRRVALVLRCPGIHRWATRSSRCLAAAADLAFWSGVRERTTTQEWRRFTASSHVILVYHRFAGFLKPGQERIDIAPYRFRRQLRALQLAGFRPLPASKLLTFHAGLASSLPRRSVTITVDDALVDCVGPLLRNANWLPQLFICTRDLGGRAYWIDGEPLATWSDIDELVAAGVTVGSHGRRHRRLTSLDEAQRSDELAGSRRDLLHRLTNPLPVVAFPNGDHDLDVCRAARQAGFAAAYTTQKGRNGIGTDPYCLRRVSIHGHDGVAAVLWKSLTGEALPEFWLRLRALRLRGGVI
jgi:peptidoglycan/xylan/chitin deacetylase (PgdA/CDA1 family)